MKVRDDHNICIKIEISIIYEEIEIMTYSI